MKPLSSSQTASVLRLASGLCALTFLPLNATPPVNSYGVWDRSDSFNPKDYPFLKGLAFNQAWKDIEKTPGVFDWSALDHALDSALQRNQYLYLSLGVGPDAPNWIYTNGVPSVKTANQTHDSWPVYPYYPSPEYKSFFERLISEFAKRIRSYPKEKQDRIAFIQVKTGCTGDECAYKGDVIEKKYDLPTKSTEWMQFRLWSFDKFVKAFQSDARYSPISLLFNNVNPDEEEGKDRGFSKEWNWVMTNAKGGVGIKIAGSGRGHHLSGEKSKIETWRDRLIASKGIPLFARSEMDQTWTHAMYHVNVPLNFYWGALTGLQNGQSVWDVTKSAVEASKEQGFDYSFYFFNRYAGQIQPETATDAFCALHKGLDAADTKSYPEDKFGKAIPNNTQRMLKICAAYSHYGAAVDDQSALSLGQVRQRDTQKGLNDVGWDIWPDNYGRFLSQINADATSVPLWRVGGPITPTSSIYARFARAFEHSSGKNGMYFKLSDGFSRKTKPQTMTVTVVWYDNNKGSTWKLDYDAGEEAMKTALTVTGNGDKQWHHQTVTLEDAVLRQGGINGSDLALINTDDKDDVFSLIEVHRGKLEGPVLTPPSRYVVSDKAPKPPKAEKNKEGKEDKEDKPKRQK